MNYFQKVTYTQYANDVGGDADLHAEYEAIKLPARATSGSAGYDFFAPCDISLSPGESIKIPTGIRVCLDADAFLMCVPRSGLGFKHRIGMDNTVCIVDQDYFFSDNEGHIHCKLHNGGDHDVFIPRGSAYMQGIILPYLLTVDDDATGVRNGGFGSTGW